jgi:hypothetical protein
VAASKHDPPAWLRAGVAALTTASGAGVGGVEGAIVGAAGTELVVGLAGRAWSELNGIRQNNVGSLIVQASGRLGLMAEDVFRQSLASPVGCQLLFDAMAAASATFWDRKISALAMALANGLSGDEASIDEHQLIVGVLSDLEPPHVRVLAVLSQAWGEAETVLTRAEVAAKARLSDSNAVLPVLVRHGLAGPPPLPQGSMRWMSTPETTWQILPFGERVLGYLRPPGDRPGSER